jgi:hypothetical protein
MMGCFGGVSDDHIAVAASANELDLVTDQHPILTLSATDVAAVHAES